MIVSTVRRRRRWRWMSFGCETVSWRLSARTRDAPRQARRFFGWRGIANPLDLRDDASMNALYQRAVNVCSTVDYDALLVIHSQRRRRAGHQRVPWLIDALKHHPRGKYVVLTNWCGEFSSHD